MPYIGRDAQTAQSQNKIIDDISSSFDGSTTSFALLVGGVAPAPFPVTSQNLLISVGGVIQEPDGTGTDGYQLTGANIVFSAAPASGQSFFGVILAGADYVNAGANFPDGDAGTPSITFSQDLDTGLFRSGTGTTSFTSNNNRIADFGTTEIVFNEDGDDINFRVEGDTEANLLFVDAGGDAIGIGTSAPAQELDVRGNARIGQYDANDAELQIGSGATGDRPAYVDLVGDTTYTDYGARFIREGGANATSSIFHRGTGALRLVASDAAPVTFQTSGTERARFDTNGALYVGATSGGTTTNSGNGIVKARGYNTKQGINNSLGNNSFNIFWTGTSPQLWIDLSNVGTISVSSDYRVKDNVTPLLDGSIDRIKQLRPVQYQYTNYQNLFTADGVTREGFIAHEVAEVIPSGVEGEKDDPNQIQSLKLDAILSVTVKALQEAVTKIETLETKVAALEAAS